MKAIREAIKFDSGIQAQSLNGNETGPYFSLREYGRVLACLIVGAMAAGNTAKIEFLQATDVDGSDAKGIPTTAEQAATATITANTKASKVTLTFSSLVDTDAFIINGLTFTCEDTDPALSSRQFASGANDTEAATNAAAVINDDTYGVPGVKATAASGVITLEAEDPGNAVITASTSDATITIATVEAVAYIEITEGQLDLDNGFSHIAAKVTTDAATVISVAVLRGNPRRTPVQKIAASAIVEPGV